MKKRTLRLLATALCLASLAPLSGCCSGLRSRAKPLGEPSLAGAEVRRLPPGESLSSLKALPRLARLRSVERVAISPSGKPGDPASEAGVRFRFARVIPGYRVTLSEPWGDPVAWRKVEVRLALVDDRRPRRRAPMTNRPMDPLLDASPRGAGGDGIDCLFWFRGDGPVRIAESPAGRFLVISGAR